MIVRGKYHTLSNSPYVEDIKEFERRLLRQVNQWQQNQNKQKGIGQLIKRAEKETLPSKSYTVLNCPHCKKRYRSDDEHICYSYPRTMR